MHPYPLPNQPVHGHGLHHDLHSQLSMPQPPPYQIPPPPPLSHIGPMPAPPPHTGYGDPYAQPPPPPDPVPISTSPIHEPKSAELQALSRENLKPHSTADGIRRYALDVVQQPQRARMCGFGDKDRRPITPPPCVRLIITDARTGKEVDCNEIDHGMYVLNVDLWSEDATKEVNNQRTTHAVPSLPLGTSTSFAPYDHTTQSYTHILPSARNDYPPPQLPSSYLHYASSPYAQQGTHGSYMNGYAPANQYFPDFQQPGPPLHSPISSMSYEPPRVLDPLAMSQQRLSMSGPQPQGMFSRNLIGSLAASAFRLTDPTNRIGIWFIMQDLSIRVEGLFRLRFSFVNVGVPSGNGPQGQPSSVLNTRKAPILASCFSDVFQVYSAKKFPGVCESTALSKCFAGQGIKIPIRKEGANSKSGNQDDDDYD